MSPRGSSRGPAGGVDSSEYGRHERGPDRGPHAADGEVRSGQIRALGGRADVRRTSSAAAPGPLSPPAPAGPGRHGHGLRGGGREPRPAHRRQDDHGRGRLLARAVPAGGSRGGRRQPPEHLPGLRDRRGQRPDVHRDGASRRGIARGTARTRPLSAAETGSLARGILAALQALHDEGIAAPRPEAVQRVPHDTRRQAPRLRPRARAPGRPHRRSSRRDPS